MWQEYGRGGGGEYVSMWQEYIGEGMNESKKKKKKKKLNDRDELVGEKKTKPLD